MATLVRCIEGHAFDRAASETCPICGPTVSKKESVVENKLPRDHSKLKKPLTRISLNTQLWAALLVVVGGATWLAMIYGIGQLVDQVFIQQLELNVAERIHGSWEYFHDAWERSHTPPSRKPNDKNTVSQPTAGNEIPNPFASPKPGNPFDAKTRF
jgi:hypothetical protein